MSVSSAKEEVTTVFFNSFVTRTFAPERCLIMLTPMYKAMKAKNIATFLHTSSTSSLSMMNKENTNTAVTTTAKRKIFLYMLIANHFIQSSKGCTYSKSAKWTSSNRRSNKPRRPS